MLIPPEQLASFLASAILLTLAPGPDNLMVLSLGMANGKKPGMLFGLGCALGCINHTLLAALGVSALLMASPTAFALLRLAGGGYLLYLGLQTLRGGGARLASANRDARQPDHRYLLRGVLASAINPKVVLFFLAFLPQFVVPAQGHLAWQMLLLGGLFTVQGGILFALLGFFSGVVGQWLKQRPGAGQWLDRLAGVVLISLGVKLALSQGN